MTHTTYLEIKIEVKFNATPFDPGVTYGPPENCYPPEGGEVEILSVLYNDKPLELSAKDLALLQGHLEEDVGLGKFNPEPDPDYDP